MNKYFLNIILFFSFSAAVAGPLSAHDIMSKNDDAGKFSTAISTAKMTTGGGGSKERVKEFTWWRKLQSDGVHFYTLTRFHFPPEVKNEGILFLEHDHGQTEVQLYLPTFKKIRRVESTQQSGSFMGSEFSYSDIAAPHVEDFTYKLIKEENCGGGNSGLCWVIESTPANSDVRDRTGLSKVLVWIKQDNFMTVHGEYSDLDGKPWKKLDASEIKEVDTQKHKWMAMNIHMENTKSGHFTELHFNEAKVNIAVPDSTFTPQNLARE